eukprot:XP_025011541.1 uncharacterized protein LOC112533535 [Gallus gallus]
MGRGGGPAVGRTVSGPHLGRRRRRSGTRCGAIATSEAPSRQRRGGSPGGGGGYRDRGDDVATERRYRGGTARPPRVALAALSAAAAPLDVLRAVGAPERPLGVTATPGVCPHSANAFSIAPHAKLSAPTRRILHGPLHSGLALSALLRLDSGAAVPLLSVRDGAVGRHFGVRVGPTSLTLFYGADDGNGDGDGDGDGDGRPIAQHRVHFSNVRIADGRWHSLVVALRGSVLSVQLDCSPMGSRPIAAPHLLLHLLGRPKPGGSSASGNPMGADLRARWRSCCCGRTPAPLWGAVPPTTALRRTAATERHGGTAERGGASRAEGRQRRSGRH